MYVSINQIYPAQVRYSQLNVDEKVKKTFQKGGATTVEGKVICSYNGGTSVLSTKEALPVVIAPFGYVLADGHHDVLCSLKLEATTVPIMVLKDMSKLTVKEFWEAAEKSNLAYLKTIGGASAVPPLSFNDLVDDPNRYFAAISARKFLTKSNTSTGLDYPLWVKIDKDIPFIEFQIADALYNRDFTYDPQSMGNPPHDDVIDRARKILEEAKILGLRLITVRTHFQDLKY